MMGRRRPPPSPLLVLVVSLILMPWATCILPPEKEVVCRNVDIRNSVENFKKLENCTVIEGFLQILLIDNAQAQDYNGLCFPDLVEITGYFLLFRAFGLNSVGKIFPNLAVIRGHTLFHNYAFVVFEMYQLQEIGLSQLTDILRGSVRIEKNPGLCYVDTVDWDQIAKEGKGGHFIKDNKKWEECPQTCPETNLCPVATREGGKQFHLCWNPQNCQKICPSDCERRNLTCSPRSHCCHQECLGGCNHTSAQDCVSCRHVVYQGRCMKKCPPNTYEFMSRRCIEEEECKTYNDDDNKPEDSKIHWKPFRGQCIPQCPTGFIASKNNSHECIECAGKCPKICQGELVDSVAAAQTFHGCTIINGSLQIQIQGGTNVIKELEENLNTIQEISGYLKIARSFPLVSLNFLKSLTVIHGHDLDKKNYALLVLDNQNLQELWDWDRRQAPLHIKHGKVFFHFNSKLCPSKILELKKHAVTQDWDERDVSPSSNGDRIACDVTNMNVSVYSMTSTTVRIRFDSLRKHLHDSRSLLGYVIYYREALYKNITMFDGRDACGADAWRVRDVEFVDDTKDYISHVISDLRPFAQYALYIRTYTTSSGRQGAQSPIIYFKTEPDTPSPPINVRARSTAHGEIVISWRAPKTPNGNVTYYIVEGAHDVEYADYVTKRDYCTEPLNFPDYKRLPDEEDLSTSHYGPTDNSSNSKSSEDGDCCPCNVDAKKLGEDEEDAEFQIHFEDFLHNNVYIKNPNLLRRRREVLDTLRETSSFSEPSENSIQTVSMPPDGNYYKNGTLLKFKKSVYYHTFLVVSHLKHFTEYTIELVACQDKRSDTKTSLCSSKAIASVRTLSIGEKDDIRRESVHVQTENMTSFSAFVRWEEPKEPNGVIVAYHVEYQRLNGENHKPVVMCITRDSFLRYGGSYLADLPSGNYSLRVRATSLAGYGNWTQYIYFSIPVAADDYTLQIVLSVVLVVFVFLLFGIIYGVYKWKLSMRVPDNILYASVNPEYMSTGLVYEPDEWEIDRDKIQLLEELGQGSFGMVYKGHIKNFQSGKLYTPCALKTVNETATMRERIEFLQEASVMKAFNCHHVIKLLGVVSKGHPTLVIMELMTNGDLKTYLRSHRPDLEENPGQPPTLKRILQMCAEIADGMAYLVAKKFVHRDLAARNCMVAEDLTVKIGDFGMTRDVYETDYYRKGGKGLLPVRWMSPESLKDGIFDSQTDVWSFGVVLWEMATLASQPYQGLSNEEVLKFVIAGKTMKEPENCPAKLYNLMVMCWHKNPKARPTFVEIVEMLLPDVAPKFQQNSFYFTQRDLMNPSEEEPVTPTTPLHTTDLPQEHILSDSQEFHFFPSATQMPDVDELSGGPSSSQQATTRSGTNSNDCSKELSLNYSDGSRGSKISYISNGIANGHASAIPRATNC